MSKSGMIYLMLNNWSFWLQAPQLHIIVIMKVYWIWWWVCMSDTCLCMHLSYVCMHASLCVCVCVAEASPESGIIADRLFLQPPRYHRIKQTCDPHFITLFTLLLNRALETRKESCWTQVYRPVWRPEAHNTAALGLFCIIKNPKLRMCAVYFH